MYILKVILILSKLSKWIQGLSIQIHTKKTDIMDTNYHDVSS